MFRLSIVTFCLALPPIAGLATGADLATAAAMLLALATWGAAGMLVLVLWARHGQAGPPQRPAPRPVAPHPPPVALPPPRPPAVCVRWVHDGRLTRLPAELLPPGARPGA